MDEESKIVGFQTECYINRRDTKIDDQVPTLPKVWRDWLIKECALICERMYIVKMREFLNVGEEDVDLSQEAFEGVKLTTIRFDPNRIPYVPAKMKRKVDKAYADLNDDIYHTKRFAYFVKEVLVLKKGLRKLKANHGHRFKPYMLGLKEWLRRQFLYAYQQYVTWSVAENRIRLNRAKADMGAYSTSISINEFQAGEANSSSWITDQDDEITTERLRAINQLVRADKKIDSEELLAFMIDKYKGLNKGHMKKEETLFANFVKRRIKMVTEKYGVSETEATATSKARRKYKLGEQKLKNDFQKLTYKAEDIFTELKEDY
jgi:hypothetical protein